MKPIACNTIATIDFFLLLGTVGGIERGTMPVLLGIFLILVFGLIFWKTAEKSEKSFVWKGDDDDDQQSV